MSDHWGARFSRGLHLGIRNFTLPLPRLLGRTFLFFFVTIRALLHYLMRVVVCEPLFKAYCTEHGRSVHTGVYVPWIQGAGKLYAGDEVQIVGRCSIKFGIRYSESPTLEIGDRSVLGHNTSITIGKRVRIGRDCLIAAGVIIFDAPGHPVNPEERLAKLPAPPEAVKPVTIGDNVWIGRECIIYPGVTIGDGAVVSAGSVVMTSVAPNTMVGGNPARRMTYFDLSQVPQTRRPDARETETASELSKGLDDSAA